MAYIVSDYHSHYREAKVLKHFPDFGRLPAYEQIFVGKDHAEFQTDGVVLPYDDKTREFFGSLEDGDIINIGENGLLNVLFHRRENDATIFMTGNCNSNCIMCPMSDIERSEDYSSRRQYLFRYIDMLPEDLGFYCVTGGEPTLDYRLFLQVMSYIADRFPDAEGQILSNGRSFSSRSLIRLLLEHCPGHLIVAIPLHAAEAGIHDMIARSPGGFKETVAGIRNLLHARIDVEIRVVVNALNCNEITNIARRIAEEFPTVKVVNFISLELRGNCFMNRDKVYLDARRSFECSREGIHILIENGINVGLYNYPLCCVDRKYWFLCAKSITPSEILYAPVCENCLVKSQCGGLFDTTLRGGCPELKPVAEL